MKKIFFTIFICILTVSGMTARDLSLSLNYFYLGPKEKYGYNIPKSLGNHGIGILGNFHLKNNFYLLADANYYFDSHHKEDISNGYVETYLSNYSIDANLAYRIGNEKFCIFPYLGIGLLDEYMQQRSYSTGRYHPTESHPGFDVVSKEHASAPIGNIGLSAEYSITEKIFVTGGIKYMIDLYESKHSAFPCLNVGIGYRFK